ncbi:glycosyltransferase family 4 protein [Oxalobacteraceae bacterium R-40]|uniref:Glycosyltransferase family 4 protein n=1 Tax=Keguizhuia sedimenti TaxID=3064264 RepID=A0ABU1BN35_9BURK|nr:glycosyltransferase family 4 protein [Oxalobacteraceae bacterium R-40]
MPSFPRVLVVHNRYQQRGGEDIVFDSEVELLRSRGHTVEIYSRDNSHINELSKAELALNTVWSLRTTADLNKRIKEARPDVIHVHNIFPLVSPSLYWAASQKNVPIVQTLHNFRMLCPQAMFLRENLICEACLGRSPWRGVVRRCYHNSVAQTAVLAGMLAVHRTIGTYDHKIARYVALNVFSRDKFIEGGLPPERIVVKPNFIDIPEKNSTTRKGALFVGRLAAEKGISLLVSALERLPNLTIDVVGMGPEAATIMAHPRANVLGVKSHDEVIEKMRNASYLVMPSIWYETFALVVMEAFACSLPVIAPNIGSMKEMIEEGHTGLLFDFGSLDSLTEKIRWAEEHPQDMIRMGRNARREYEKKYTSSKNYQMLMAIYEEAIGEQQQKYAS